MADFTDQDKELLDRIRKVLERAAKTTSDRTPWQEHISRDESVNANRATLAAKVLEGFSGSWAAQYNYGLGSTTVPVLPPPDRQWERVDPLGAPIPIRAKTNKIGRRGPPEVNFVPYNWRTNTFGSKGPSLVGHPISFETVGPTLKSPFTDWTWRIDQGAGPNGGDLFTPDVRPDGAPSSFTSNLLFMYGPLFASTWTLGDSAEPNGGLYLVVTDDGVNPGSLASGQTAMGALPNFVDTAHYEIFRISEVTDTTIEVHPNKPLSNYFDLPAAGTRWVRAVMIIKPYVTRLAAIPQTGELSGINPTGREQTFAVVSPERAATSDLYPPFAGAGPDDGSWFWGGFTEARAPGSGVAPGDLNAYGGGVRLPIPIPVTEGFGEADRGVTPIPPVALVGTWKVDGPNAPFLIPQFASEYPIARISVTQRNYPLPDFTMGSIENALGWFDVIDVIGANGEYALLARVPEADPQTGLIYYGPGPYIQDPFYDVELGFTLYQPVSELWRGAFDIDKVEATRISNLIDPRWVDRFAKQISDPTPPGPGTPPPPPRGSGAGRPDKAIFATEIAGRGFPEAANPGNLMDLGFRMVLYPAKEKGDLAVPDFDLPIVSRETVIDGSITDEDQFIDIDYSAGIVRLSVAPPDSSGGPPSSPSDIVPNGIVGLSTNNQRGEVVLFAACVPYSMEDSQVGTGARITSHEGAEGPDYDVSSAEVRAQIDQVNTNFTLGLPPYFGPTVPDPTIFGIVLDRIWDGPETGVVSLTQGKDDSPSFGEWGYTQRVNTSVPGVPWPRQVTILGGLSCLSSASDPTPTVAGEPVSVVLRREAVFSPDSLAFPNATDPYVLDTTFGSSIRADTLRFQDCRTLYNVDGSVTVVPHSPGFTWHQAGGWAPCGTPDPVEPAREQLSHTGILGGVFYQEFAPPDYDAPSSGNIFTDKVHGQYWRVSSGGTAGDHRGVITRKSQIVASHNFRLVVKFRLGTDHLSLGYYIGLIGPTGGATITDAIADAPGPPPGFDFLGLRLFGPNNPSTPFEFVSQDASGGNRVQVTTGFQIRPLFLVIETEQYFDSNNFWNVVPTFATVGLYDEDFRELGRARFYNQNNIPKGPMELCLAVLKPLADPGGNWFELFYAKLVNRTDLPFAVIP